MLYILCTNIQNLGVNKVQRLKKKNENLIDPKHLNCSLFLFLTFTSMIYVCIGNKEGVI